MDINAFLGGVVDVGQLKVLAYLITANFGLGVLAALFKGKFEFAKLKDIWKRIGVIFGAYVLVTVFLKDLADFAPLSTLVYATLVAYVSAKIVADLKELGLPVPDSLMKWVERTP